MRISIATPGNKATRPPYQSKSRTDWRQLSCLEMSFRTSAVIGIVMCEKLVRFAEVKQHAYRV